MQVKQSDMARDVIEDFEAGIEYVAAECLIKMKRRGQERLYLVRYPPRPTPPPLPVPKRKKPGEEPGHRGVG